MLYEINLYYVLAAFVLILLFTILITLAIIRDKMEQMARDTSVPESIYQATLIPLYGGRYVILAHHYLGSISDKMAHMKRHTRELQDSNSKLQAENHHLESELEEYRKGGNTTE